MNVILYIKMFMIFNWLKSKVVKLSVTAEIAVCSFSWNCYCISIYYLGELLDYGWTKFKESIFE